MLKNSMKIDHQNQPLWNKEIKKNKMLYPSEHIVRFLARQKLESNEDRIVLDIGIGSGRNAVPFLDKGYLVEGVDYSIEALNTAKKNLKSYGDGVNNLYFGNFVEVINKKENFYDFVICMGTLFLNKKSEIEKRLKFINTILKKEGSLIINFRSKEDFLYQKGVCVEKDVYELNVEPYKGMIYSFYDSDELKSLFVECGFSINYIEKEEYHKNNLTERHSWWIISAKKNIDSY